MNNMRNISIKIILVLSSSLILSGYAKNIDSQTANPKIAEIPIKVELLFKLGSDKENEDFYGPRSFTVDSEGRIFILDTKNSRVQCFSKEGKFLFSFGRYGQGPGELSESAKRIKILEDNNIYIIDRFHRKINVYDRNGGFIRSWKISYAYNDIELIDGKYYLSHCYMQVDNKPIHVFNKSGKIEGSFGTIIEPEDGILEKISKEKEPTLPRFFNNADFSRINRNKNKEILFSLEIPYRIIKYDTGGRIVKDVIGNIDYGHGKEKNFKIIYRHNIPFVMPNMPLPHIYSPIVKDDGTILVPLFNKERGYVYIDLFDQNLKFIERYKIQERLEKEGEPFIKQIHIDKENNLYYLISSSQTLAQIVKYKMIFD